MTFLIRPSATTVGVLVLSVVDNAVDDDIARYRFRRLQE